MRERIGGLDELRGLAILAVMIAHFWGGSGLDVGPVLPFALVGDRRLVSDGRIGLGLILLPPTFPRAATTAELTGWTLDTIEPPGTIDLTITLGDERACTVVRGEQRGGLATVLGEVYRHTGWSCQFDAARWAPGPHELVLTARSAHSTSTLSQRMAVFPTLSWPWNAPWLAIGSAIGVDLFFVISGFLITGILVTTRGQSAWLRMFYFRRSTRILPLALVMIGLTAAFTPAAPEILASYLFFYNNYLTEWTGLAAGPLKPMWSLAVEEQFYVLFPLIVMTVPRRFLWLVATAIFLASWTAMLVSGWTLAGLYSLNHVTHLRAYVIAAGVWLALLRLGLVPRPGWALAGVAGWTLLVVLWQGQVGTAAQLPVLVAICLAVWLAISGRCALNILPLRYLGLRCYGLYLWHVPVLLTVTTALPGHPPALVFGACWLVSLLVAEASYRWFEMPILRLQRGHRENSCEPAHVVGGVDSR